MIEAFEIGITLALQDGVSESISAAQRNLAALKEAVHCTGVSVQSLREAGLKAASIAVVTSRDQTSSSPVSQSGKKSNPVVEVLPELDERVFQATKAEKPENPPLQAASPVSSGTKALVANQPTIIAPVAAVPATTGLGTPDDRLKTQDDRSDKLDNGLKIPSLKPETSDSRPASLLIVEKIQQKIFDSQAPVPTPLPAAQAAAPESSPLVPVAARPAFISIVPTENKSVNSVQQSVAGSVESSRCIGPQDMGLSRFAGLANATWTFEPTDEPEAGWKTNESSISQLEMPTEKCLTNAFLPQPNVLATYDQCSLHPVRPTNDRIEGEQKYRPVMSKDPSRVEEISRFDREGKSGAPQVQRQQSEDLKGDIYLDGMLVGRWISRFLLKQAGRSDAGPTGFDAKRGRLLPGVTVGG